MSGLNPFFLVWWVTMGSLLLMTFLEFSPHGLILFIVVHWLCDLVWLSLVSFTVYRTHSFLAQRLQKWIFVALGVVLLYFGGQFIVKGILLVT